MIEPGTYAGRARTAALGYTSKNTEQVAVELVVTEGEFKGQSITWYGYFTEKTMDRTIESLTLLGWDGDNISDLAGIDRNEVSFVVEEEFSDDGQRRVRVRWINAPGGVALQKPMDAGQAQAFAQRIKGSVLAYRGKKGSPAPRQQQRSNGGGFDAPPHTDDDIPF